MILLTGASGSVGFELTKLMSARGIAAKAMVRSEAAAGKLKGLAGIEPVAGDFDDPASLDAALQGVERAFLVTNSTERAEIQQLAFLATAKRAGVRHIVKLSQLHAATDSPVRFLRYHGAVEQAIRASGIAYTFLRPNLFMQGLLGFADTIANTGKLFAPIGASKISLIDIRDIAAVAFAALSTPGHEGQVYDLTGPDALTHDEIATQIGAAIGQPVSFVQIPPDTMRQAAIDAGFLKWQADGLIEDYAHYARDEASAVSPDGPSVIGQPARPFAAFLADYKSVFTTNQGAEK
ncbi:SDR family oxidoreductase [Mesorhizobium sp. CGMCC 1.15528]|uniref:SDR family oxidoreductase n=1 Tax=Mesorhizobium zhangyense TaxID=1776730 RepID=A0A7C9R9V9_9HYPH|nr:SDR family oxidoreductase [Mesorhizobium zhangyense]NGN43557.1 SDR family oxidoreductase [Mesorhizobium zhangyense]